MSVSVLMGVFHHVPDYDCVGMQSMESFAPKRLIPQICVALTVNHSGTCYYFIVILCYKQIPVFAFNVLSKKDIVWNITFGL